MQHTGHLFCQQTYTGTSFFLDSTIDSTRYTGIQGPSSTVRFNRKYVCIYLIGAQTYL